MNDQASVLRGLVELRDEHAPLESEGTDGPAARTISVTSGKGGVGKSSLALNLGVALALAGRRVCLLDANLGVGNIDLLCGLNGYWNLAHVVSGARTLSEIMLTGPAGLKVIPGASGLIDVADCSAAAQQDILRQIRELEQDHEFLLIDTGSGIHRNVRQFVVAADLALIVTTPEPTAIADAYATVKALGGSPQAPVLEIVVNRAESAEQARDVMARLQRTTRTFLRGEVGSAGFIPEDRAVALAVRQRMPFVIADPHCPAARAVEQLSRRMRNVLQETPPGRSETFLTRLWGGLCRVA